MYFDSFFNNLRFNVSFSLLTEKWLPLRRKSGARVWVSPAEITDQLGSDPFMSPDWGRADFDAATYEFLIGLFATAYNFADERDWRDLWRAPPSCSQLAEALAPLEAAFQLLGDGPRFMQELGALEGEAGSVSGLFIEAPGANAEKNNTDLFQKRGGLQGLSLPAAAMALFTLQSFAPAGGAGHRTSLRGGGPLTTLVLPEGEQDSLFARVWLNVPVGYAPLPDVLDDTIFPWLAPTKTSETGILPLDFEALHPLVAFWWMPRRIVLQAQPLAVNSSITGEAADVAITHYRTKPWGMNGVGVQHPLSPMYRGKLTDVEWLFVHPQPGGLTYNLWVDLAFAGSGTTLKRSADIVSHILARRQKGAARLFAAGYDMDNMKARGFCEAVFPVFGLQNGAATRLEASARGLVGGATNVLFALKSALRQALNIENADATQVSNLSRAFYDQTEAAFFNGVRLYAQAYEKDDQDDQIHVPTALQFLEQAQTVALRLFDLAAPLPLLGIRESEMKRLIQARQGLVLALKGYGKVGKALFDALGLPLPEPAKAKASKSSKKKQD